MKSNLDETSAQLHAFKTETHTLRDYAARLEKQLDQRLAFLMFSTSFDALIVYRTLIYRFFPVHSPPPLRFTRYRPSEDDVEVLRKELVHAQTLMNTMTVEKEGEIAQLQQQIVALRAECVYASFFCA